MVGEKKLFRSALLGRFISNVGGVCAVLIWLFVSFVYFVLDACCDIVKAFWAKIVAQLPDTL